MRRPTPLFLVRIGLFVALVTVALAVLAVDMTVNITASSIDPQTVTIDVGDTVTWNVNSGIERVFAEDGTFDAERPGTSAWVFDHTFDTPGTVVYNTMPPTEEGMVIVQEAGTPGRFRFTSSQTSVSEGSGEVELQVSRSNGTSGQVTVDYATSNQTATAGSDYSSTSGTLSWADGDGAAKTITIPILEDTADEGAESFRVSLSNPTGGASLGSPNVATVTINDNEGTQGPGTVQFTSSSFTAGEAESEAVLSVSRTGGSNGEVGVSYSTSQGIARAGEDFTSSSGILTWASGDTSNKTITVPLVDDTTFEGSETFRVSLSDPTGGASLGSPAEAKVVLTDDQIPTSCTEDATTLCLTDDRFLVRIKFLTPQDETGQAQAEEITADTGFFTFFNPDNVEVIVKALDVCVNPFNRFWVFAAGLTNVETVITVVDTESSQVNTYLNPLETPFAPIQDTDAFATCP